MISFEEYRDSPTPPIIFTDRIRHETALREATESLVESGTYGQNFSMLRLNRDMNDKPPHIEHIGAYKDTRQMSVQYAAYLMAASFPDRQIVVLDSPYHGASSGLTHYQKAEAAIWGNLTPLIASQYKAVEKRKIDLNRYTASGKNLGASLSAHFISHSQKEGLNPQHFFAVDPSGFENRPSIGQTFRTIQSLRSNRARYTLSEADKQLKDHLDRWFLDQVTKIGQPVLENSIHRNISLHLRDSSILKYTFRGSPLSHASGFNKLTTATVGSKDLQTDMIFGAKSVVGRYDRISDNLIKFRKVYGEDRLKVHISEQDSQGIGYYDWRSSTLLAFMRDRLAERQI
jgi:hypothetical protein